MVALIVIVFVIASPCYTPLKMLLPWTAKLLAPTVRDGAFTSLCINHFVGWVASEVEFERLTFDDRAEELICTAELYGDRKKP